MVINKIYNENCLDTMNRMDKKFIQSIITSPPYFNLRDYGNKNQIGIEDSFNDYLNNLLDSAFTAIPKLIEKIHFNPSHPENHNIKITNKKEPYVKIMKDNKWEFQDRKNTITDLIDKQHIKMSDEKVEKKIERQCTSQEKINIVRCNDMYMEEEDDYMKRLYNESELVMFNN